MERPTRIPDPKSKQRNLRPVNSGTCQFLTLAEVEAAILAVLDREIGPFRVLPATRRVWGEL